MLHKTLTLLGAPKILLLTTAAMVGEAPQEKVPCLDPHARSPACGGGPCASRSWQLNYLETESKSNHNVLNETFGG